MGSMLSQPTFSEGNYLLPERRSHTTEVLALSNDLI